MEKIGLLLIICFSSIITFSQVEVINIEESVIIGKIRNGASYDAILSRNISGNVITINYLGFARPSSLGVDYTFSFNGGNQEINVIYNTMMKVFDAKEKNFSIGLKLGDETLIISKSIMGCIIFGLVNRLYTRPLNDIQINKLFDKY